MYRLLKAFCAVLLFVLACPNSSEAQDGKADAAQNSDQVQLVAVLQKGNELSRIILYIHNSGDEAFEFETGARGGPGSLDDGFRFENKQAKPEKKRPGRLRVIGSAPTVIPDFVFKHNQGRIRLCPPALSGPTKRAMRPASFRVASGQRRMYCSFSVPTDQVTGDFLEVRLVIDKETELQASKIERSVIVR